MLLVGALVRGPDRASSARARIRDTAALAVIAASALVLGGVCFVVYRRLPTAFFQAMLVLGTLLITGAVAAAAPGSEGVYGFFYVWVVFGAFLFFPLRSATAAGAVRRGRLRGGARRGGRAVRRRTLVLSAVATLGAHGRDRRAC